MNLSKRHPNISLKTDTVYGLKTDKNSQVFYRSRTLEDTNILYTASRFLLEESIAKNEQTITECHSKTVSYVAINEKG